MLLGFTVENYRSIRDAAQVSWVPARAPSEGRRGVHLDPASRHEALTVALVYGANASGKSNVLGALAAMRWMVLRSAKDLARDEPLPVEPFALNPRTRSAATELQVVFVVEGVRYRYGFRARADAVEAEWLFHVPKQREARLFERTGQRIEINHSAFGEGALVLDRTRPNALFLSVVAQFDGPVATRVQSWFARNVVSIDLDRHDAPLAGDRLRRVTSAVLAGRSTAERRAAVLRLITGADLGILEVEVARRPVVLPSGLPPALRTFFEQHADREVDDVDTVHRAFDDEGNEVEPVRLSLASHGSAGTQRLFALAGPILEALSNGGLLVCDELDNRMHPQLTRAIVERFLDPGTNPHGAQLLLATHQDYLLEGDLIRRDQVWLTEKDALGATAVYSLADFKGVRRDEALRRGYLGGRYGGIPALAGALGGANDLGAAGGFEGCIEARDMPGRGDRSEGIGDAR